MNMISPMSGTNIFASATPKDGELTNICQSLRSIIHPITIAVRTDIAAELNEEISKNL